MYIFCQTKAREMWDLRDLKMLFGCLLKMIVISATVVGCLGAVGSLVNLNSSSVNEEKSETAKLSYQQYSSRNKDQLNMSTPSPDLDGNSSYMYAVIVSPPNGINEYDISYPSYEYELPFESHYDISRENNDYNYYDYQYEDAPPIIIMKHRRRRPNRYRMPQFRLKRRRHRNRYRNRDGFRHRIYKVNKLQRRYKSRRRELVTPIIPIKRQFIARRKLPILKRPNYINIVSADKSYLMPLNLNANHRSYLNDHNEPTTYGDTNRRHQNYQNSIITGSKSSGLGLGALGLFGLLQFFGIILNVGLGKAIIRHLLEMYVNPFHSYLSHTLSKTITFSSTHCLLWL